MLFMHPKAEETFKYQMDFAKKYAGEWTRSESTVNIDLKWIKKQCQKALNVNIKCRSLKLNSIYLFVKEIWEFKIHYLAIMQYVTRKRLILTVKL